LKHYTEEQILSQIENFWPKETFGTETKVDQEIKDQKRNKNDWLCL